MSGCLTQVGRLTEVAANTGLTVSNKEQHFVAPNQSALWGTVQSGATLFVHRRFTSKTSYMSFFKTPHKWF